MRRDYTDLSRFFKGADLEHNGHSMTNLCPSCGSRRGKRACPALGEDICAVCCGTKRQVEIQCPPTCAYLSSARTHPAAVVMKRRDTDLRFVVPLVQDLSDAQHRLLLYFQAAVVKHARGALPPLLDEDVAAAAAAVAATLETARKGIIYEHQADSLPARRLAEELNRAVVDLVAQRGAPPAAAVERDAAVALRRLEQGARTAAAALPGDSPPVYLSLLGRILGHAAAEAEAARPDEPGAGLIIPGR